MCNCWNTFLRFKCCVNPPAPAAGAACIPFVPEDDDDDDGGCGCNGRVPLPDSDGDDDDDAVDGVVKVGIGDNEVLGVVVVVVVVVAPLLLLRRFMIAPDRVPKLLTELVLLPPLGG